MLFGKVKVKTNIKKGNNFNCGINSTRQQMKTSFKKSFHMTITEE